MVIPVHIFLNRTVEVSVILLEILYLLLSFFIHVSCSIYRCKHYL
nr:MAG TPA: hypothetical protein [Caudoviricetes sp.]